ncbi:molybdenum cofactor guanylyltransferase [bacterium]|nr:molybdenum cofactor guanylyltransferase [bacterium]
MKKLYLCQGQPLSLIVLTGGLSRRMKRYKALLPTPEGTLIEHLLRQLKDHFDDILISVSQKEQFEFLPYTLVEDEVPGEGPMMGLKTTMPFSKHPKIFVTACDIPYVRLSFLEKMIQTAENWDIVVPCSPGGRLEPLFAVYSKSVLPVIQNLLESGIRSLLPLLHHCRTRVIPIKEGSWFQNLNTKEDYEQFLKQIKE